MQRKDIPSSEPVCDVYVWLKAFVIAAEVSSVC